MKTYIVYEWSGQRDSLVAISEGTTETEILVRGVTINAPMELITSSNTHPSFFVKVTGELTIENGKAIINNVYSIPKSTSISYPIFHNVPVSNPCQLNKIEVTCDNTDTECPF